MIVMMNFELNSQVSEVQFESVAETPQISTNSENGQFSLRNSAETSKALYESAGPSICRMLRCMSCFPVESARMCGYMMRVNMYDMICVVTDYVDIEVHM